MATRPMVPRSSSTATASAGSPIAASTLRPTSASGTTVDLPSELRKDLNVTRALGPVRQITGFGPS